MPEDSSPLPMLANLALTNSSVPHSVQDRGGVNPDGNSDGALQQKPLHWDKLRAISGRTTIWDQVNNSDSFLATDYTVYTGAAPIPSSRVLTGQMGPAA
jgi:hypothetical protein